jgi:hypothetical protein
MMPDDGGISWSSSSSTSSLENDGPTLFEPRKETTPASELEDALYDITHVITCLYEFSVTIRNPAPRDRLDKCSSINVSHFEPFDIQHVSDKFPNAERYLVQRLGKANTRRRQLLRYHEKHHQKIAQQPVNSPMLTLPAHRGDKNENYQEDAAQEAENATAEVHIPVKSPGTVTTSRETHTTVSTYVPREPEQDILDACSDTDHSQTSYASSANSASGGHVTQVPPPPDQDNAFDRKPFECPYCYAIISVSGTTSWMYVHIKRVHSRRSIDGSGCGSRGSSSGTLSVERKPPFFGVPPIPAFRSNS